MEPNLFVSDVKLSQAKSNGTANKLNVTDKPFHDWYRFVLSFPPHLVREYFSRFEVKPGSTVLDPFSGTGTTPLEAKINGISSVGIEANLMAHFAGSVKIDWNVDPDEFLEHSLSIGEKVNKLIDKSDLSNLRALPEESMKLLLKDSISPLPLHKSLILVDELRKHQK
jgi:hypothetical protein